MNDLISREAAIDTDGLDEEIRCEMCKNPMHTSKGCDGNCEYDERLYERIMQILGKRIKPLPSAQPERKKGNEKCSNELPCGWCSLFDTPCFGRGGEQDE